ncbi:putative ATP-dependent RNA helicase BoYb [Drosophila serrata]|uniref:putative ATP-dependent RNA helicase BoYb n=1 Tax=Drosophila serrata TaxID=7274 RepID=UPI000A1D22B2|nr:putative ATP-dependent RNA helicase BoYb [Drosophila serrata]
MENKKLFSFAQVIDNIVKHNDYEVGDPFYAGAAIRPLVAPNCSEYVVAHAKFNLRQVRSFSEVCLLPHILHMMQTLGLNRLQRLQSYSWPHLNAGNGHGAMIISAPRSGRTFGYIPPLCDQVCRALTAGRRLRGIDKWYPDQEGPLAVILVPDAERVSQVSALCHALLRKAANEKLFTLTLTYDSSKKVEIIHRLLNGVGCMVFTPAQLVVLHEEAPGVLRFPRLQFLVFDDVDLMSSEQLQKTEQVLRQVLPKNLYPQFVMVSQTYDPKLMAKLKAANSNPALIFGDILEAAVYGGTCIRIAFCNSERKVKEVLQTVQQRPPKDYRTVVYCSDDIDMLHLAVALEKRCHACLPYFQSANLEVAEQVHRWMAKSQGVILLCTDDCPELTIRHADTLIHYGMSSTWSKFKMRHLAISGNLKNNLAPPDGKSKAVSLHSLVLLDQQNQRQLPRLVDFLQKHQKVDDDIVELVKKIRQENEEERMNQNIICRQIMVKGSCKNPACEERHHVTDMDKCHASVPTSGDVKVQLVRVYSPTHFCVYLEEHLPPQGSWQRLPSPAAQHMRIQMLQDVKQVRYWPPVPGDICMYHSAIDERVRVLQVPPINGTKLVRLDLPVLVQAIDIDTRIFSTKSSKLFKCSAEVQQLPPMAIDLRLLGLEPFSQEGDWTEKDRRALEYRLKDLPEEHFLQAHIQIANANTLFVRNLVAMTYASTVKMHVRNLSVSHILITEKLAKKCEETEKNILAFFTAGEEVEYAQEKIKAEMQEVKTQIEDALQMEQKEDQKENVSPNKPISELFSGKFLSQALNLARKNQLNKKQEEDKALSSSITQEPSKASSNRESKARLDLEEQQQKSEKTELPKKPTSALFGGNFLSQALELARKNQFKKNQKETIALSSPMTLEPFQISSNPDRKFQRDLEEQQQQASKRNESPNKPTSVFFSGKFFSNALEMAKKNQLKKKQEEDMTQASFNPESKFQLDLEEQQQESEKNESPKKHASALFSGKFLSQALELPKENQLKKDLLLDKVVSPLKTQEQPETSSSSDTMAQLYECLMRCTLLDLEELREQQQHSKAKNPDPSSSSIADFLNNMMTGGAAKTAGRPKKQKKLMAIQAAPEPPHENRSQKIQSQLPPNVVRPTTSYYQTQTTLELQVLLPEEAQEYEALLEKTQIFFWAICKSSELKHQFVLSLSFPYISLTHRMCGRTVYISVQKAMATVDPLHFNHYPFMKPNHEMFAKFDEEQKIQENNTKGYLKEVVSVEQQVENQDDEDSSDEDQFSDEVEIPAQNKVYED